MKKPSRLYLMSALLYLSFFSSYAQKASYDTSQKIAKEEALDFNTKKAIAIDYAKEHHIPIKIDDGFTLRELMFIDDRGMPQYYITYNENAAKTISTNKVYSGGGAGLNLSGSGVTVSEWDGGSVRSTHDEFDTRVTVVDAVATHYHATHVAGTIMASGVSSAAKGMAFNASLNSYDWNDDNTEMANAAANGTLISNHSYGYLRGWNYSNATGSWTWYGDAGVDANEDYLFGFYNSSSASWDEIAYNAPYYLIVKSAGNDRNDSGPGGAGDPPPDGPYDCIGTNGIAKNVLTVGAVNDITAGYALPTDVVMTSFSSWGPADDGRIKPDIVANGSSLTSCNDTGDSDYLTLSGTSMSSPSVTGSAALLIQHYENVNGAGSKMKAATLKALIINTADEAGTNDGPDYQFGWGLMNTKSAAEKISNDLTTDLISEHELLSGGIFTREIITNGTDPIKVTIVWTDPAGAPVTASLNPTNSMLVNDLDLRITEGATTYYPWKLDVSNPTNAATHAAENNVDNVEQVEIASPTDATTYTITVDHDGSLSGGSQYFSMIISGNIRNDIAPLSNFTSDNKTPTNYVEVQFTDESANIPSSWAWSFSPSTVNYLNATTSSSQNPQVEFTASGTYQVSLTATNAYGSHTETKVGYITVSDSPTGYCEAYSGNPYGFISRVQIGDIDKTSTDTNVGGADPNDKWYEDWTALSTDVIPGYSYNISITNNLSDANLDLGIWVDWNRDADFDDSNEQILCGINNGGEGTFTINVPTNVQLGKTRMRIRSKYYGTSCNSCGATSNGEVEDYTLRVIGEWTGTSSTDWATAANWSQNAVPRALHHVIIPSVPSGGIFPLISSGTAAECNNLEIKTSASLSIRGSLTVNGNLTNTPGTSGIIIKSDASGMGSLIQSTSSISATIERYIEAWSGQTDGWHFMSSPIATFNILGSNFEPGAGDDLFSWSESEGEWNNYKAGDPTQIVMGQGYLISRSSTLTKDFLGILNNADKTWTNLSFSPAFSTAGWHLLGNPFSSAISWGTASWNMTNIGAVAKIYNEATGSLVDISGGATIPSTQGFLVYVSSATNSITIPKAERIHSTQNWYKEEEVNKIKLTVFDLEGHTAQESIIRINKNATPDFDIHYDSYFFKGFAPEFYSVIPEGNLSTNTLPSISWNTVIPLSFIKNNSSTFYIEAKGMNGLNPQETVYLTDLKLNKSQNLNSKPLYYFSSQDGDITERFLLHFSPLNVDEFSNKEKISVFFGKGLIEFRSIKPLVGHLYVNNLSGQLLANKQINNESYKSINLGDYRGVVLVTIITDNRIITKKLIVF